MAGDIDADWMGHGGGTRQGAGRRGETGQRKTGSGKWYDIGPLFVRGWYWQVASRYNLGAMRGTALTSADVKFWALMSGHRRWSEIDEGCRMGKPRSDG